MNDQSPPKRVTRSRAAAKSTDTGLKTAKVATAAAKAKLTRNAPTTTTAPTATKRKTRTHDIEDDAHEEASEEHSKSESRATRGRPKKVVIRAEPEPVPEPAEEVAAATKARRGRARSTAAENAPPVQSKPAPAPAPVRATRGRAKKTDDVEPAPESATTDETKALPTRSTRTRAVAVPKVTVTKKSVKFEDQDKENVVLGTRGKEKTVASATGLRAKPVRRPAATTARATRGRAKPAAEQIVKSPLSPKKTQVSVPRETEPDDVLVMTEKTPIKPLSMSPVKPPGSIFGAAKKLDFSASIAADNASTQELQGSMMTSPARRPPQSPFKESMKTSPQRLTLGDTLLGQPFRHALLPPLPMAADQQPSKTSLLQSPARRPVSPTKVTEAGSPTRTTVDTSVFNATPKPTTFAISRFTTPKTLPKPAARAGLLASSTALRTGLRLDGEVIEEIEVSTPSNAPQLEFSGRLSSIVSRHIDPTVEASEPIAEEEECPLSEEKAPEADTLNADVEDSIVVDTTARATALPRSPPAQNADELPAPEVDENPPAQSDSEDELSTATPQHSSVPLSAFRISTIDLFPSPSAIPFTSMSETIRAATSSPSPRISRMASPTSILSSQRGSNLFDAEKPQSEWVAESPIRRRTVNGDSVSNSPGPATTELHAEETTPHQPSPVIKNSFFEEEMSIRQDELAQGDESPAQIIEQVSIQVPALEPGVSPVEVDEEDIALAAEADEMSLLASDENVNTAEDAMLVDADPEPSEDSQEYGDENAVPLDPALFTPLVITAAPETPVRSTPKRVLTERISHTVSKVPLKPAAEDTPRRPLVLGRSATVSRLPAQKPTERLKRNNTVISYSPGKKTSSPRAQKPAEDVVMKDIETPSKSESQDWSTVATPARTPRRDLNTALLKGAVVFVDVHTTEGADASGLFTELLTQMGARCVKTWNWNGNTEDGSKIGITHVVFKDGGKRTLEKARETGGVVACVGVGWVLDCERENKWLDETPYAVDISLVPRGGHRRRKSMEPRALANLNGQLVSTSSTPSRKSLSPETPMTSKVRRRDSVQWVRSPASSAEEDSVIDDQTLALSPVPATPAPEAISAYAEDFLGGYEAVETPYFLHAEKLTQQTCPPPKRFDSPSRKSSAFISDKKDENIMAKLMAARRKSLQWAPKVGSPLAKAASWSRSP